MSITLHLGMDGSRLNSTFQWKLFDELNEKEDTVFLKLGMCCLHKVHKWYKTRRLHKDGRKMFDLY